MPPLASLTRPRRRSALALVVLACGLLTTCGPLAACGGESGDPAAASPSPAAPGSRPLAGTPREAAAAYWALVDAHDYAGLKAACVPGSTAALTAASDDIGRATVLRTAPARPVPGGVRVPTDVRIVPAGEVTPWGEAGPHTLFVTLVEAPGGGWLVDSWATSP